MASNSKIQLNNKPDKLEPSDSIYGQLRDDLQFDRYDVTDEKNTFDLDKFNKKYEDVRKRRQKLLMNKQEDKLRKLNITTFKKKLHEYTVGEYAFGMKDAILGILGDLLRLQFTIQTFTKNNRLFYLGMFILINCLVIVLFSKNC